MSHKGIPAPVSVQKLLSEMDITSSILRGIWLYHKLDNDVSGVIKRRYEALERAAEEFRAQ